MSKTKNFKNIIATFTISGILLTSPLMVQAELGDQVLKSGMTHEDIKILQEHLIDLKYLDIDNATTYYGDLTVQAVADFQRDQKLTADGVFGQDTFDVLSDIVYFEPLVYERLLKEGINGDDVLALQERLKSLGFLDIDDCTDYFGSQTEEALMGFQKAYGLKADGVAGSETINTINKAFSRGRKPRPKSANRGGSRSGSIGEDIVNTAKKYMGTEYSFGSSSASGFDCSGFTQYVYKQHDISIPRDSSGQAGAGTKLSRSDMQIGDLIIFSGTYRSGPSHTGIYIGGGKFIHSSSAGGQVMVSDLDSGYYKNHFSYGRRVY
mgnify:FL=1